jgi:hypothetical protein
MKKLFIVMIVAAMAVAACGGKKAAPAQPTGTGSAATMPADGSADGSAAAPAGGETPPPSM